MAENDSVTGLAITIPEEVFTDLNRLEKKIMGLDTITNNISGNIVASFLRMANGVDPFIKKVSEAESLMGSFRNIDVAGGFASLGKSSTSIEKSTSAIVEMANTMNRTDFSTNIENAHKRLQTLIGDLKIYEEYLNTPNDANQALAAEGIEQTSKEIKEIIAVIPELEKLQSILSRNDLFQNYIDGLNGASLEARRQKSEMSQLNEYYRELEKTSAQSAKEQEKAAAQAAKAQERAAAQASKAQERQRKEYQRTVAELWKERDETAKGALESANAARTYNQRAQAMKNLDAAIKNLDKNDKNYNKTLAQLATAYRNLETQQRSVTNAMGQMQQSQHNLMDISGQLMRRLALVFSVSQVTQYVQKLAQVRGEFELQNAALAAIMQNKDEADQLFSQITQLAVQSPFNLKELVRYTKELSAYRVENEKLYDTTKMLADVSAGLGIDMSRLILALGQVKAANYLRGCLGYGTPIMLFNGDIKEVQNIVVGDVLINENGEPVNVLELIRGRETMFLVEQVTGHNRISYRVNRNHILTLWNVPDQKLEDVYVYDYLKNKDYYLGCRVINGKKEYYDIEVTKDRIDDYYGFVLDGNKRFRLGDGTITHNTELRQFSEAGINILGELATYFSEIEQRAVSVGEVFDMVSRRMVTFQDVEKIFQRITSEGGIFANMQEVQSRTLAGMVSNLQDAVDIMLNDIGKETEGTLKGAVNLMRQLVENWRTVAAIGKGVLIPLASYLAITKTLVFLNKQYNASQLGIVTILKTIIGLKRKETLAQIGLNTAANANPYIAIASLLIGTITTVIALIRNAKKEQEEYNRTIQEGATQITELSANYERLANIATSDTSSAEEQTAAIEELNRTYGELIPSQYRNIDALKEMAGDYTAVTNAINDKIAAQTREKLTQDALTNSAEKTNDDYDKLIKRLQSFGVSQNTATKIVREFKRQLDTGLITSVEQAQDVFGELAYNMTFNEQLKGIGHLSNSISNFAKPIRSVTKEAIDLKKELEDIENLDLTSYRKGGASVLYENLAESLRNVIKTTEDYKKQLQDSNFKFTYSIELDEAAKDLQIKNIQDFINQLQRQIDEGILDENDAASVKNIIEDARAAIEKIRISDVTEDVNDLRVAVSRMSGIDFGSVFNFTEMRQGEGRGEYLERLNKELEEMSENIDVFYDIVDNKRVRADVPKFQADYLLGDKTLEQYENEYNTLKYFLEQLMRLQEDSAKGGSKKDENKTKYEEWISLLKEVNKEYENLLKEFNAEDAKSKIELAYQDTFVGAGIGDLIGTMEFDASGIIEQLEKMMAAVPEEYKQLFRKALDNLETEIGIDVNIKNRKAIEDEMSDIISDYNISMEFFKLGGTPEMSTLLGFDYTTLDDVAAYVEEKRKELIEKGGEENLKLAEKLQEQYSDLEIKQLRENTKKYLEYLNESKDDRLRIEEDYQRRLAELQETQLTDQQKQQATENLTRERDQKLAEYDWNQFRDTDLYRNAFEDLERVGTRTLDILIRRLEEFAKANASAMSTEDFREYMNTLKQVRTELESRNPWKTLVNYVQQYNDAVQSRRKAEENLVKVQSDVDFHTQEKAAAQEDVDSAQQDYDKAQSIEERVAALERLVAAQSRLETANSALSVSMDNLKEAEDKVTSAENSQQEAASGLSNILSDISSDYNTMVDSINGVIDAVLELAEDLGIAIDDETSAAIEGFQKGFSVLGTIMSALIPIITAITVGGTAMQAALWPLLVIGAALGAVMAIVAAFNAKRQAIIDAEQEKIDALSESYDELVESLDQMTSTRDLQRYSQELQKNVEQQVASYDKMIAAEKSRKNPDEEQIAEWEKAQEDLLKQSSEDLEAALVKAGGVAKDDYLSTAEDFVNAWVEAFKETGDGLSGLEDNFDEFFHNVLISQAALAISKKFIDPLIDDLNEKIGDNFKLTDTEKQEWYNNVKAAIPGLNAALEAILGPWIEQAKDEEGSLSGLQKGIQGVTEETAQIIEALLNSMRYYVADTNAKLNSIYLMLSGTEGVPNPMLVELRAQTEQLRAINRLIRNVTASGHPNGGDGIKIFMN